MKKQLPIAFLIIISILIFSCKKEEPEKVTSYLKIEKSLYPLLFEEGSYWNYVNTETSDIDRIELTEVIHENRTTSEGDSWSSVDEVYECSYTSSINNDFRNLYLGYLIMKSDENGGLLFFGSKTIGEENGSAIIINIHPTYQILDTEYHNVTEFYIEENFNILKPIRLFYADSIGLVKKVEYLDAYEAFDSIVWNLQDYNVSLLPVVE